ncbi:MAG: hypothetical protein LBD67_09840 [Candidatus Accumulibacter sp.]|nr:hypothetical protein [Accumulibacter sp.]
MDTHPSEGEVQGEGSPKGRGKKDTFPIRSPCSVLNLSKGKDWKGVYGLERPFILRQAQHERK